MKKLLLSVAVLFLTVFYVNAQSFVLEWNGDPYYDGDTIHFEADSLAVTEMVFEPIFKNNTNNGVNVNMIRDELLILEGTVNYFCWDTCYLPSVDTSVTSVFVPAGSSSAEGVFAGHYETNEVFGVSLIEYKFLNKDNPDEYVTVVVKFDASPEDISEYILNNVSVSDVYPNPADNFVNINYDMPVEVQEASVKIVNLYGSVVMEGQINTRSNKMRMNITDLKGGIYFYSIFVNGEIYNTKKLLVK